MRRAETLLAALLLATGSGTGFGANFGTGGCAPASSHASSGPARNAVLITIDTLRADALGCQGGRPGVTPALDRLAAESVRFANARAVAPLTLPAHASMLTGLLPPRHGLRDNGLAALPDSAETVAERCRAAGLDTAAFVSSAVLDHAYGLAQGFERYEDPPRSRRDDAGPAGELRAATTFARARAWLEQRAPRERFFLWIHVNDPHVPYDPPPEFAGRTGDPYLDEVAAVDAELGRFVAGLRADGLLDDTLLVVTADHGESRGEHGEPTHGALCYDAALRVPLLVRRPDGTGAGTAVESPVTSCDVQATLLDGLGLGPPGDVDGRSLLADVPADRGVYFESYSGAIYYGWSPLAGWVDRGGKYLHSSKPEFYRPADDPGETRELAGDPAADPPVDLEPYRRAIAAVLARPRLAAEDDGRLSHDLLRELRALGYGAFGPAVESLPDPLAPSDRPAPAERAGELALLLEATSRGDAGDHAGAAELLRGIVAANPHHRMALDRLGLELMHLGAFAEARDLFHRRLDDGAPRVDTHLNLAICLERTGDAEGARREREAAQELAPAEEFPH